VASGARQIALAALREFGRRGKRPAALSARQALGLAQRFATAQQCTQKRCTDSNIVCEFEATHCEHPIRRHLFYLVAAI
jgi:hypothetical protein